MTDLYKLATDIDDRIETVLIEKLHDKSGFLESILTYGLMEKNFNPEFAATQIWFADDKLHL